VGGARDGGHVHFVGNIDGREWEGEGTKGGFDIQERGEIL